jgi:hypothetical protein
MSKDFPVPQLQGEEVVIGTHSSGVKLVEGDNTNNKRYYCGNCNRKIHCYVKVDSKTKEATIHKTCKNDDCECKCRTHYACKGCGYLHPYGELCNRKEKPAVAYNPDTDKLIEQLNKAYNERKKESKVEHK